MGKQIIRLTESDLHNIIKESVQKVLSEGFNTPSNDSMYLDLIADGLQYISKEEIENNPDNVIVPLSDDYDENGKNIAIISCDFSDNRMLRHGWRSNDRDLPDDPDEFEGECNVVINKIVIFDDNYNSLELYDDGRIRDAIKEIVCIPEDELEFYPEDESEF